MTTLGNRLLDGENLMNQTWWLDSVDRASVWFVCYALQYIQYGSGEQEKIMHSGKGWQPVLRIHGDVVHGLHYLNILFRRLFRVDWTLLWHYV